MAFHPVFCLFSLVTVLLSSAYAASDPASSYRQFPESPSLLSPELYYPGFWLARCPEPNRPLMSSQELAQYNRLAYGHSPSLCDLSRHPDTLSSAEVIDAVRQACRRPRRPYYHVDGRRFTERDWQVLERSLSLSALPPRMPVRWALAIRRCDLRTFPTADVALTSPGDAELDRFQETGINTGEALAILHSTGDGAWHFVQRFNYRGWVSSKALALGTREQVLGYLSRQPRLVITGACVRTAFTPHHPAISRHVLDMGDSLPLASKAPPHVDGMGIGGNWVILLPTRTEHGTLQVRPALISRNSDVSLGYLPLTRGNLIRQAFKLQGERYGWGDAHMTRDCTGFIISVFRSFGLVLPRNSSDHMTAPGLTLRLRQGDTSRLDALRPGDVFESPSHAMLYLGKVGREHYVIHDTLSMTYEAANGSYAQAPLRQITVTPLLSVRYPDGRTLADTFSLVRRFVLPPRSPSFLSGFR